MRKNYVFEDGKWWYVGTSDGIRRTASSHERKNKTRMFVAGKYIPKSHPMHKPGTYSSFEDAWNHKELDASKQGYVYAIINPAWPGWIKVGMAVDANDRLRAYQTSSPLRDYALLTSVYVTDKRKAEALAHRLCHRICEGANGEWFKLPHEEVMVVIEGLRELKDSHLQAELKGFNFQAELKSPDLQMA